ncbi:hypothetical protein ABMA27_011018 [Loxostege sticticalis]|uniref:BPTI/Kunitz inhibitor domain-containing protein n=1 Tax=Loxostege sticticalis TaxID=481309 RepID=A0ABR3H3E7_LOXSC
MLCHISYKHLYPRCTLPLETGRCLAYFPRFGYNIEKRQCEEFIYGGCLGNRNRFTTLDDCQRTCEE